MTEIWAAVGSMVALLTVVTLLFMYVVRAEVARAIFELRTLIGERYATKEQVLLLSESIKRATIRCPPTCGFHKEETL